MKLNREKQTGQYRVTLTPREPCQWPGPDWDHWEWQVDSRIGDYWGQVREGIARDKDTAKLRADRAIADFKAKAAQCKCEIYYRD